MTVREEEGKEFGVIVLAEGLGRIPPPRAPQGVARDEHGHISISQVNLRRCSPSSSPTEYHRQMNKSRRLVPVAARLRSALRRSALAFDVMLGSQLGVGAYRASPNRTSTA